MEQDTRQLSNDELEQRQRMKEHQQFQEELDTIIERLDQQIAQQEENTEEQVIDDQAYQQSSSTVEELSSHESVTEEKSDQQNSPKQSIQTWEDELISKQKENVEEQPTQDPDLTETDYQRQEDGVNERIQEVKLNLIKIREENAQFQQELDEIIKRFDQVSQQLQSTEKGTSSQESVSERSIKPFNSPEQSPPISGDLTNKSEEEQRNLKLDRKKAESSIQENQVTTRNLKLEVKSQKVDNDKQYQQDVERIRHSIIQAGNETIQTGKHSDLSILARKWNDYISKGGRPTTEMWKAYNKIQEVHEKPLVLYKENDELRAYKISNCGELYSQLDRKLFNKRLSNPGKQISKLLDYWLIQTGKKEGINPFFEVTLRNFSTEETETYWIANAKQRQWNPYKAKDQRFFTGYRAAGVMISKFLTTKIKLNEEHIELYPRIEKALREKYPKLGVQTGRVYLDGQKVLFKTFYKLNHPSEVTDEAIKLMFWKYVDSRPKSYIQTFSRKISRLITYCNENNITSRNNIMQTKIFVPNSIPFIPNSVMGNKLQTPLNENSTSDRDTQMKNSTKKKTDSITYNKKTHITSRPIVRKMLSTLQKIEDNFGLNDLSPKYKPPMNLILNYENSNENKLIIKADSENDKDLAHFLLEGFGLSSKAKIEKGAFWFGKIMYPMKGKSKNEWHRFTRFISSRSERKIENHDKWYASKHAGSAKTIKRRVLVEIGLNALKEVKAELMENAKILANDNNHRKWLNHSRADAKRNKNPETALQRLEENISWWNRFIENPEIQTSVIKQEEIAKDGSSEVVGKHNKNKTPIISENYQTQALLYIMNSKKSAFECLTRVFEEGKITNIEFLKIADEIDENSPRIRVLDVKTGELVILNEVLPIEERNRFGREGVAFDVFHENLSANIAFKAQLEFFNRYNPSQSPLVSYLGLNPNELKNCEIELQWSDRNGYPSTGISMTDTFAPDIVVRNHSGQIIAVIQLKGYSQTRTSIQPNASVFQVLELKKYDKNPRVKTALVNVHQEENFIIYEWLVLEKQKNFHQIQPIDDLGRGYKNHPELDPLIPKNLRKRAFVEDIYKRIIESKSTYDISNVFNQIKETILASERNFYRFIGHKEENIISEKIIQNYLNKLKIKLQMVVNKVDKPDGINSCSKFRYYWANEVVLDYYERIREYLGHSSMIDT
ncbi:MAG: hypothetical protein ACXACR_00300 [Candidatus Hodarchaeales archaeon]